MIGSLLDYLSSEQPGCTFYFPWSKWVPVPAEDRVEQQKLIQGQLPLVEFLVFNSILDAVKKRDVNLFISRWFIWMT